MLLVVTACTAGGPTAGPPTGPVLATAAPTSSTATPPASIVSTAAPPTTDGPAGPAVSADADLSAELIQPGTLVICSSFPRTRFAEFDAAGNPFGVDVEIGQALAAQLGLAPRIDAVLFDDLIDTVANRQCDASIAGQFITSDRLERIAMIPYREGAPNVIVTAGNPLSIDETTDLCGRRFGVVRGSVYVDLVRGVGDFEGEGIDQACASLGGAPVDLIEFADQEAAEDALAEGAVDAYAGNDFVVVERPGEFELSVELPRVRNAIGHRLDAVALDAALREALRAIIDSGEYLQILERYDAEGTALTIRP